MIDVWYMFPLRLSLFALLLLAVLGLSQEVEASSVTGIEYPDGKIYRSVSYEINITVDGYQEGDTLELDYYSPNYTSLYNMHRL